jgi:hypothetical protein
MNSAPDPNILEAMKALVRQCEGGKVIYRARRGDAWLCTVTHLKMDDDRFTVGLQPLRRVDTAMWRQHPPSSPFDASSPWNWVGLTVRKHALVCTRYVDWCITFDPQKVAEIEAMAEAPKMPVGDLLSVLRRLEIE